MTFPNARRQWLRRAGAAALLVPGGFSGLIREALAAGTAPVAPGIQRIKGEVFVNDQPAKPGMRVGPGDTVRTGKGAEAIYVIGQDAYLQRDNSIVSFGADAAQQLMRVVTGKILSVFGKGPRQITTSTATIGIRGTGCYIEDEASPEGPQVGAGGTAGSGASRTYFCLCYGEVELTPTAAPNERISYRATHHDKPLTITDDMTMPTMMAPAHVINHTDLELTMLEALVGRRPPFAGREGQY